MMNRFVIAMGALALVAIATLGRAQTQTADDLYLCITSTMDETNAKSRYNAVDRDGKVRECARQLMQRLKAAEAAQTGGLTAAQRQQLEAARAAIADVLSQVTQPSNPPPADPLPVEPPPQSGSYRAVAAAIAGAAEGEWRRIPGTRLPIMTAQEQAAIGCAGTNGPASVVNAWNGASRRGAAWYFGPAGGHTNNGCNERYRIDLDAGTAVRLYDPSPLGPAPDFNPAVGIPAYHTYQGVIEHSDGRSYIFGLMQFRPYGFGEGPHGAWVLDDPEKPQGRRLNVNMGPHGYTSACELANGLIFVKLGGNANALLFDPVTETVVAQQSFVNTWSTGAACVPMPAADGKQRVYLIGDVVGVSHFDVDLNARSIAGEVRLLPMAEIPPVVGGRACARYHARTGKIILWPGGRETAFFDPATGKVYPLSNSASPAAPTSAPGLDRSVGVYSKCELIEELDVLVGLNNHTDDAWAWRIPATLEPDASAPVRSLANDLAGLQPGGAITLPATEYRDGAVVTAAGATINGAGAKVVGAIAQGKAALVIAADGVTIDGLEISGSSGGENIAGIRGEFPNLTLRNLYSHHNDSHVMTSGVKGGTLNVIGGRFVDALGSQFNPGQTHGFYLGYHDRVIARGFELRRTGLSGHNFKARAQSGLVENFTIAMEGAESSRSIDLSMGGDWIFRDGTIQHGANGNQDIIGFAHEVGGKDDIRPAPSHSLLFERVTITCDRRPCVLLTKKAGLVAPIVFKDCTFIGVALPPEYDGGGNTVR